jgi:hypothetical protein
MEEKKYSGLHVQKPEYFCTDVFFLALTFRWSLVTPLSRESPL